MIDSFGKLVLVGKKMPSRNRICFGTMRLADKNVSSTDCAELFDSALDSGIRSFHVSSEYSSFELVSETFSRLEHAKKTSIKVISKLASPHFSDVDFDESLLESRVDKVLVSLGIDQIDVGQWMWRVNPLDDEVRINRLKDKADEIKSAFARLQAKGKVRSWGCFPYTVDFFKASRTLGLTSTHINYLNFWENNLADTEIQPGAIAIRPFFAGKSKELSPSFLTELQAVANSEDPVFHSLNYVLSHPNIHHAVVGINSIPNLNSITAYADKIEKDIDLHKAYRQKLETFQLQ